MATATAPEAATAVTTATEAPPSLIDQIIEKGGMAKVEEQKPYARDLLGELATQVLEGSLTFKKDTVTSINERIAQIDKLIQDQLNPILHAEPFQRLEASWRGLHYLVKNTETSTSLKLRLLNVTKKELLDDLQKAVEFDQSVLFKMIYEEEYGTFGGHPIGLLIGDYEFGRLPQDIALLEELSHVAAAAHAPLIAAASAQLADMDSFAQLGAPRDLAKIFESTELIKWNSLRNSDDARYLALVLPHVLLRLPYGPKTLPVDGLQFEEDVDGKDHKKYLWGNAGYALGVCITNAFAKYQWCAAIRGVEGGGLVEGLPTHTFKTDEGDIALKCPTEIAITDRREKELNDLGLIALCHCKNTDYAAFFGGQTVNRPKLYDTDAANANSRLSALLPYILAASRFAHYVKAITREKIGSFMTRENLSQYLNRWIKFYTLANDDAGQELKAKSPLKDARVDVLDVPGKPGAYTAVLFLQPHFQLEELTASIRLVANLPAPPA
ncbi:MAG: type VI secretion system contractile sheath large subunit [Verrucomicrobiales bacterium]|nr:type VI secretion system contractile sheath large subunit [Verrucomicrobiales bacterium]